MEKKYYLIESDLLKRILNHLEGATDEGPYGEGWQSE